MTVRQKGCFKIAGMGATANKLSALVDITPELSVLILSKHCNHYVSCNKSSHHPDRSSP